MLSNHIDVHWATLWCHLWWRILNWPKQTQTNTKNNIITNYLLTFCMRLTCTFFPNKLLVTHLSRELCTIISLNVVFCVHRRIIYLLYVELLPHYMTKLHFASTEAASAENQSAEPTDSQTPISALHGDAVTNMETDLRWGRKRRRRKNPFWPHVEFQH